MGQASSLGQHYLGPTSQPLRLLQIRHKLKIRSRLCTRTPCPHISRVLETPRPPIGRIGRSSNQCGGELEAGTYWSKNNWRISGSHRQITSPTLLRPRFRLRLSFNRPSRAHDFYAIRPRAPGAPRPPISSIERRSNTAVAELRRKVNARTLTYSAARSRHQNTNVRTRRLLAQLW